MWKYRAVLAVSRPSKSVCEQSHMGSNPILSANGTLENPVFSRVLSIRQKNSDFDFLCFCRFSEPILCSFSPVNIRIKNLQTPREIRLFKACILFAALERFPSDKKSPNFKTPGCGQPHQKSCVDFSGRGSNRQKEKCALLLFVLTLYRSAPFEESDCVKSYCKNS